MLNLSSKKKKEKRNKLNTEKPKYDDEKAASDGSSSTSIPNEPGERAGAADAGELDRDAHSGESELEDEEAELTDDSDSDEYSSSSSEYSSMKSGVSEDERRLKYVFIKPQYVEPKHPIISSPFAQRIGMRAFGPKKPKWYKPLSSSQLYLFKDILNYVEVGRGSYFRFDEFMETLEDFDPSCTRDEVLRVFDQVEVSEFEELDFGKFLFLFAYKDQNAEDYYEENIDKHLTAPIVTPRQSLILSAIAYFMLISTPEEIARYYRQFTRRKSAILHHYLESCRLEGLTGKEMEAKQRIAAKDLGPLYYLTGSPYALPVPFVRSSNERQTYKDLMKKKYSSKQSPFLRDKPARPLSMKRVFGERVHIDTQEEELVDQITYGRIRLPEMAFPPEIYKVLKTGAYTIEIKDHLLDQAKEARKEFRESLKVAAVVYARRNLRPILHDGFPSGSERDKFIEIYKRYLPLQVKDVKNYSLWVKPSGYKQYKLSKKNRSDDIAFGAKIPKQK